MSDFLKILENEVQIAALSFMAVVYVAPAGLDLPVPDAPGQDLRRGAGVGRGRLFADEHRHALGHGIDAERARSSTPSSSSFTWGSRRPSPGRSSSPTRRRSSRPGRPAVFQAVVAAAFVVGIIRLVRRLTIRCSGSSARPTITCRSSCSSSGSPRPSGLAQQSRKRGGAAHRLFRADGLLPRLCAVLQDLPLSLLSVHPVLPRPRARTQGRLSPSRRRGTKERR